MLVHRALPFCLPFSIKCLFSVQQPTEGMKLLLSSAFAAASLAALLQTIWSRSTMNYSARRTPAAAAAAAAAVLGSFVLV